ARRIPGDGLAARLLRGGQLTAVEPYFIAQVFVVVIGAGIENGDDRVRPARGHLPRQIGRDPARARRREDVVVRAEQVPLASRSVTRGRGRTRRRREERVIGGRRREAREREARDQEYEGNSGD